MSKLELQIDEKGLKVNKSRIIREISALYIKERFKILMSNRVRNIFIICLNLCTEINNVKFVKLSTHE